MTPPRPDEAIRPTPEDEPRLGTESLPRADIAVLEQSQPRLVDAALRGPVILTRHGRDAFVLMPVDMFSRLARDAEARRLKGPPVIEGKPGEG